MKRFILCLLSVLVLSGCGYSKEPPVIAKKSEETKETAQNAAGTAASSVTLQEQVNAPKQYKAEFQSREISNCRILVSAEADVELPKAEKMPVKKIRSIPFDSSDYQKLKQVTQTALGITWGEDKEQKLGENGIFIKSREEPNNHDYAISYSGHSQTEPDYTADSYMIMSNSILYESIKDYTTLPVEKNQEDSWRDCLEAAEQMIKEAGFDNVSPVSKRWITGRKAQADDSWGEPAYYRAVTFSQAPGHIPVTGVSAVPKYENLTESSQMVPETITVVYSEEGTLESIYCCNREEVMEDYPVKSFLLPFSDISAIFENTMKNSASAYGRNNFKEGEYREIRMNISHVTLGYMSSYDQVGPYWRKNGKLIPVWDFFGTVEIHDTTGGNSDGFVTIYNNPDTSLLTLNALDGTVTERKTLEIFR